MPTFLTQMIQQIAAIWRRLTMPARVAVGMTVLIAVGLLGGILFWSSRPSYVTLATDLSADEIAAVYQALEGEDIAPKIRDGGRSIAVPANRLSDGQRVLAEAGMTRGGSADADDDSGGLFKSSSELERRNLRRREQTIARLLERNRLIISARVVLAGGRRSIYRDREDAATAAVQLSLRPGAMLTSVQVQSVVQTVANAVTGLDAKNVTVTDDKLNTLVMSGAGGAAHAEGSFLEFERLWRERKVSGLLEGTVGPDGVRVVVTVEAEFVELTTTTTTFDSENRVVLRETSKKSSGSQPPFGGTPGGNAAPSPRTTKTEDKTKDYAIPETITTGIQKRPRIMRVTAGIFVDRAQIPGDDDAAKAATIAAWATTLATAIGTGESVGETFELKPDLLKITPSDFIEVPELPEPAAAALLSGDRIMDLVTYGAAGLAGLGLLLFFRSSLRAVGNRLPAPHQSVGLDLTIGGETSEELAVNVRVEERNRLKREISRAIEQDPRAVAKLVEMWLTEEGD